MENDKKLNMFKETWEEIQKIKKEKTIPYQEKGKAMAKVVIEKYNLKHPLYLVDFIKKIFIDNSKKGFSIKIKLFETKEKDKFKDLILGKLVPQTKEIIISNKISNLHLQRLTIAHEIAHIFIDTKKDKNDNFQLKNDIYYQYQTNSKEVIYDDFAANLLVVDSVLNARAFCDLFEITSVKELAFRYKIPMKPLTSLYEQISKKGYELYG